MLDAIIKDPENGAAVTNHVIFLHGYGSGGKQMSEHVGNTLGPLLPHTKFHFLNAPDHLGDDDQGYSYYSWFPIDGIESEPDENKQQLIASQFAQQRAYLINDYIDHLIHSENTGDQSIVLLGFSQGASMAYYAGLMRDKAIAGVFSLSGGALKNLDHIQSKPSVFLSAGDQEHQPYSGVPQQIDTYKKLKNIGFDVTAYILPNQGHDISLKARHLMASFTKTVLKTQNLGNSYGPSQNINP
jgi:phospholipase/carboxylesterase